MWSPGPIHLFHVVVVLYLFIYPGTILLVRVTVFVWFRLARAVRVFCLLVFVLEFSRFPAPSVAERPRHFVRIRFRRSVGVALLSSAHFLNIIS